MELVYQDMIRHKSDKEGRNYCLVMNYRGPIQRPISYGMVAKLMKDLNEKNTQALEIIEDLPARVLRIVLVLYDSVPVSQKAVRDGCTQRIKKT
jgi:hypothetical protein